MPVLDVAYGECLPRRGAVPALGAPARLEDYAGLIAHSYWREALPPKVAELPQPILHATYLDHGSGPYYFLPRQPACK